jgi:hypothetical protein
MKTLCRWLPSLAVAALLVTSVPAAEPTQKISAASQAVRERINLHAPDGCRHIYGFNYQPSWGHNGLTVWGERFDAKKYREELSRGKKYFPKFNAVRIWLSWSAYQANPERYIRHFQQAVDICGELDLLVVPVIYNRWIGNPLWDRVLNPEITADFDETFAPFIRALVVPLRGDRRILAWDLCNEPYIQGIDNKTTPVSRDLETEWLGKLHAALRRCDPGALICIGTMPGMEWLTRTAHLQDILTPHLYYPRAFPVEAHDPCAGVTEKSFALAKQLGKPMMSTECCWGGHSDAERAGIVRTNLAELKRYGIAFFPHALYFSWVADLHQFKIGLYMPFILEDGSLRPGHEVYNEFTR